MPICLTSILWCAGAWEDFYIELLLCNLSFLDLQRKQSCWFKIVSTKDWSDLQEAGVKVHNTRPTDLGLKSSFCSDGKNFDAFPQWLLLTRASWVNTNRGAGAGTNPHFLWNFQLAFFLPNSRQMKFSWLPPIVGNIFHLHGCKSGKIEGFLSDGQLEMI